MQIDVDSTLRARRSLIVVLAVLVAAGVLVWRYSPLSETADSRLALLVALIIAWILLVVGVQRLAVRLRRAPEATSSS